MIYPINEATQLTTLIVKSFLRFTSFQLCYRFRFRFHSAFFVSPTQTPRFTQEFGARLLEPRPLCVRCPILIMGKNITLLCATYNTPPSLHSTHVWTNIWKTSTIEDISPHFLVSILDGVRRMVVTHVDGDCRSHLSIHPSPDKDWKTSDEKVPLLVSLLFLFLLPRPLSSSSFIAFRFWVLGLVWKRLLARSRKSPNSDFGAWWRGVLGLVLVGVCSRTLGGGGGGYS